MVPRGGPPIVVHDIAKDLFNWHVGLLNNISWSPWGAGAFHVGLQIYDVEYAFGGRSG